jgi:hypothetical protein
MIELTEQEREKFAAWIEERIKSLRMADKPECSHAVSIVELLVLNGLRVKAVTQ